MSTMPWSSRYSARWKPFGQLLADGLLDDARTGEADQRAGLGNVDVAEHGVGGGDAAGGRMGQHHDVRQPRLAQLLHGDGGARHLHQREDAFLHARAAGSGKQNERRLRFTARAHAGDHRFAGGGAERAAHEIEILHGGDDLVALQLAGADKDARRQGRSCRGRP